LILLETGMMFLGVTLLLLFSQFCKVFFDYTNKTKMSYFKKIFVIIFLLIIISTSIIPSYTYAKKVIRDSPTNKEVEASLWLKNNVQKDSKVLATLEEGYLISYFSERSNIWDRNFLFIENSDQIYKDVNGMFTTNYETEAIRLVNKYQVDYIYFSNKAKEYYNVNELKYTENKECFELVFDNGVKIFKPKCILEEI